MYLEIKPEGEAQTPSLEGFIAWLSEQPSNDYYNWLDMEACVGCQYAKSIGQYDNWMNLHSMLIRF
jgi:hypothetical protein